MTDDEKMAMAKRCLARAIAAIMGASEAGCLDRRVEMLIGPQVSMAADLICGSQDAAAKMTAEVLGVEDWQASLDLDEAILAAQEERMQ